MRSVAATTRRAARRQESKDRKPAETVTVTSSVSPILRMRNAKTTIQEKRNAVSVISHTHLTAYCIVAG
jgi:hypothetical protein